MLTSAALSPVAALDLPAPTGVAYMINASPGSDASLRPIISSALVVQMARRKAMVQEISGVASQVPPLARSLATAADRNNQFLLLAVYSTSGREIALVLQLYDVATTQQIGGASVTGRIDLNLDTVVTQAVEKTTEGVEFREAPEETLTLATTTDQVNTGGGQAPDGQETGSSGDSGDQTADGLTADSQGSGPAIGPGAPVRRKGISLGFSSGAAPFLPTGPAGAYVALGGLATLQVSVKFPLGPGTFSAGILSGVGMLRAAGVAADADVLLVPIGVDAQYTFNDGGFPGITLHLSGGPAIMNVKAAYAGPLTKLVPYALAGMILDLPFSPFIGLTIEAAWAAFFESVDFPIMGFVPGGSLYVRF